MCSSGVVFALADYRFEVDLLLFPKIFSRPPIPCFASLSFHLLFKKSWLSLQWLSSEELIVFAMIVFAGGVDCLRNDCLRKLLSSLCWASKVWTVQDIRSLFIFRSLLWHHFLYFVFMPPLLGFDLPRFSGVLGRLLRWTPGSPSSSRRVGWGRQRLMDYSEQK